MHLDYPEQAGCYEWTLSIFEVQDVFGIHPRDLTNQIVDLSDLPNTETLKRIKDGLDIQTREDETADMSRLAKFAWGQFSDRTQQSLQGLCDSAGVSNRRLEQVFKSTFGVSPKKVQSLLRYEYAVELMQTGRDNLSDIAASAGYSDQSHMTREVSRFSGLPPARLRALLQQIA
ncbi:MAG: AraC family transcriptional regulator [Pseudomonadota bacterium]